MPDTIETRTQDQPADHVELAPTSRIHRLREAILGWNLPRGSLLQRDHWLR